MNIDEALRNRISVRAFLAKEVSEKLVVELLEMASWSPSGGNLQPWNVIVVANAAKSSVSDLAREVFANNPHGEADDYPIYPKDLGEPYRSRRFILGEDMYAKLGIPRTDKAERLKWVMKNFEFFGAPVGIFFVIDRSMGHGQWAHLGMFMQSLALAAVEKGLATCMQEAWAKLRHSLHGHFRLPDEKMIYCGMALGWPDTSAPVNSLRSERATVSEFATFKGF